jgi:hypothetical protein
MTAADERVTAAQMADRLDVLDAEVARLRRQLEDVASVEAIIRRASFGTPLPSPKKRRGDPPAASVYRLGFEAWVRRSQGPALSPSGRPARPRHLKAVPTIGGQS